jgi:hypothetical protein
MGTLAWICRSPVSNPAYLSRSKSCLSNISQPFANSLLAITNPNGTIIFSTNAVKLDVPHLLHLLQTACHSHIVPGLSAFLLISIGQLCDAHCNILFQTNTVSIGFRNTVIMQGTSARATGLWHLNLAHNDAPIIREAHTRGCWINSTQLQLL